jgi:hypothetical protein
MFFSREIAQIIKYEEPASTKWHIFIFDNKVFAKICSNLLKKFVFVEAFSKSLECCSRDLIALQLVAALGAVSRFPASIMTLVPLLASLCNVLLICH